jgi:hypothetical protein
MAQEAFCEQHGPYDARLGACPYCARQSSGRPQPPPGLDDEEPTDPWGGRPASYDEDLEETDPRAGRAGFEDDYEETELPRRMRRRGDGWDDEDTVVERPAKIGLLGWLIVKEGTRRGHIHEIKDGITIGREPATLLIRDPKLSRPHAKITIEDDQFVIWDFGTENGTFVNGEQIRSATPLKENDEVKMGDTVLVLKTLQ